MPDRVAEVQAQVDPGKNKIDMAPTMHAECDAICRCTVYAIRVELAAMHTLKSQGARRGNGMTHRGLLDIGRNNAHVTKTCRCFRQGYNARAVNTVIVRAQDSHVNINETCIRLLLAEHVVKRFGFAPLVSTFSIPRSA